MTINKLILFAKYPVSGQVKTRIAEALGNYFAFGLYKSLLADVSDLTRQINAETIIVYSGPEGATFNEFPGITCILQRGNNIGERMYNAFMDIFSTGSGKCLLIGGDTPDITVEILHEGYDILEQADIVLGPTTDGGYYCIGIKEGSLKSTFFQNIPWSTSLVFTETINRITETGLSWASLPVLSDLDEIDDLKRFYNNSINELSDTYKFIKTHEEKINKIYYQVNE
jgi:rSAM/selenodomain-associated transferase 1